GRRRREGWRGALREDRVGDPPRGVEAPAHPGRPRRTAPPARTGDEGELLVRRGEGPRGVPPLLRPRRGGGGRTGEAEEDPRGRGRRDRGPARRDGREGRAPVRPDPAPRPARARARRAGVRPPGGRERRGGPGPRRAPRPRDPDHGRVPGG